MANVGNSSRGRSQGVPKFLRVPMYRAHCAVFSAIAQLSCLVSCQSLGPPSIRPTGDINSSVVGLYDTITIR